MLVTNFVEKVYLPEYAVASKRRCAPTRDAKRRKGAVNPSLLLFGNGKLRPC